MPYKGQGAFEYILLLAGVLLVVILAIVILRGGILNQANAQIAGSLNTYSGAVDACSALSSFVVHPTGVNATITLCRAVDPNATVITIYSVPFVFDGSVDQPYNLTYSVGDFNTGVFFLDILDRTGEALNLSEGHRVDVVVGGVPMLSGFSGSVGETSRGATPPVAPFFLQGPVLNATTNDNTTDDNLTCNWFASDWNDEPLKGLIDWRINGTSAMALNMPFEGGSNSTWTRDYSSFGNNGTVNGSTWLPSGGHDGRGAYQFNGDSEINMGNQSSFFLRDALTISAWINIHNVSAYQRVVSRNACYFILLPRGPIRGAIYTTNTQVADVSSTDNVTENTWYHVAFTYDRQNLKLYLNGVLNNTAVNTSRINSVTTAYLTIGSLSMGSGQFFDGVIDDVQIYNRSLSAEQVLALYEGQTDLMVSQETGVGDVWQCSVTPNDGSMDGPTELSNTLEIIVP